MAFKLVRPLRTMLRRLVPLLLVVLLAGCSSPDPAAEPGSSVTLITDPSQGRTDPTMGEHLHDYWGSSDRKVVVDTTVEVGTLTAGAVVSDYSAAVVRPEPGDVVPQGTATVEVTFTWTPSAEFGAANQFSASRLGIRTAADREAQDLGPIQSGQMVVVPSTNEQNDLPHQVLSGWEFHWILEPVSLAGAGGFVSWQGQLTVHAEAVRGLEIPIYPGHPDQWLGRSEIPLFSADGVTGAAMFEPVTGDGFACFLGCPAYMVPDDGVVIPIDADRIELTIERDAPLPTRLGLVYHNAISRDWVRPEAESQTDTSRTYVLFVDDGGDGAYTKQSNWEFQLVIDEPVQDGAVVDTFRVSATVYRYP